MGDKFLTALTGCREAIDRQIGQGLFDFAVAKSAAAIGGGERLALFSGGKQRIESNKWSPSGGFGCSGRRESVTIRMISLRSTLGSSKIGSVLP